MPDLLQQFLSGNIWENLFPAGSGIFTYVFPGNVAITASTEATAQVVMDIASIPIPAVSSAQKAVVFQFYIPAVQTTVTGKELRYVLFNENTANSTGIVGYKLLTNTGFNLDSQFIQTYALDFPPSGTAHYSLRAFLSTATGTATIQSGNGGAGNTFPMQAWVFFSSPINV